MKTSLPLSQKRAAGPSRLLYGVIAGAVLALIAGCAAVNPARPAWRIEPVMDVKHAGASSNGHYLVGRYYDGMKRWDQAAEAYRQAIAVDPKNVEAHNALGVVLAHRGQFDEAELSLRRALAIDPSRAHVLSNLGFLMLMMGRPDDAVVEIEAALQLDRHSPVASHNLREAFKQSSRVQKAVTAEVSGPTLPIQVPVVVSVPAPIRAVSVPAPLSAPVELPAPLVAAMRVIDQPTVQALRVGGAPETASQADQPAPIVRVSEGTAQRTAGERESRIELSNGNGVAGMARRLGQWLAQQGVQADRLTNQRPFTQQQTIIEYRLGQEEAARRVARALPFVAQAAPAATPGQRADVRVVLGHDWAPIAICLKDQSCKPATTAMVDASTIR